MAGSLPTHLAEMAGLLLAAFPILLMVNTPLAWACLGVGIALLVSKRLGAAKQPARTHIHDDASI